MKQSNINQKNKIKQNIIDKDTNNISAPKNQRPKKNKIKSWYSNRYQIIAVQRNILLLMTVILMIAMTASIIFVKFVVSSKSLEPYVIEVEEKSGIPTVVDQMTVQNITGDEAIKRYFVNQFIQASASYNPRTYKRDTELVRLLSNQAVYSEFRSRIRPKDLGVDSRINMRIKSLRFLGPNTAQIRILREFRTAEENKNKDEVINMNFYFTNITLTKEERLINPLGFQVTNFSITEEIFEY